MAHLNFFPLRAAALALSCVAFSGVLHAQSAPAAPQAPAAAGAPAEDAAQRQDQLRGRQDQKIERIHIEDSRNDVNELRYGGQTQSITVKPKGKMPQYEVTPQGNSRSPSIDNQDPSTSGHGPSKWDVLKF